MLYNRFLGIYKFGNNTYPQRIRRRSNLGHIFGGKKCVLWAGKYSIFLKKNQLTYPGDSKILIKSSKGRSGLTLYVIIIIIKEQETRLTLHEHDDDDDDVMMKKSVIRILQHLH